ncbi:fam-a protein [Plasmodium chabaudi adami]|uniref:Fam-a protein n=1 Tax=Plasmodium chabaudi adami TaxID=5826 RepID=A0A1C6WLD6_PLACE|nr:fam-a protein [Plasmodium chabaudi adami]
MNKFYIQIVLFLLRTFLYVNNKTLATELAPNQYTIKSINRYSTPEEIYEKNKHLLCTNPEETINAEKLMNEALIHIKFHAISMDDYEFCVKNPYHRVPLHTKKRENNIDIEQIQYKVYGAYKLDEVIDEIWDPDSDHSLNKFSSTRKVARVYSPNLIMIQQRYKKWRFDRQKYFYALATKVELSKYTTIIVMISANINDHYPSNKEYKNKIIENANLFTTEIDSEEDIRKGKLKKTFVNLAGYFIQEYNSYVDIIYVESIDGNTFI